MQIKTTVRSLWKFISLAQIKMTHNHDCDHRERMKSLPLCGYEQGLFQTVKGKKKPGQSSRNAKCVCILAQMEMKINIQ